jgi:hypothetical protein
MSGDIVATRVWSWVFWIHGRGTTLAGPGVRLPVALLCFVSYSVVYQ